ncbi:hypothetical protein K474DRAFT_1658991 [Panus rudis PR-1116 ss-1]|nr:hypothetical protein K474DRAFT_1658991 [Panus rudis PR-1116 ss-1]
MLMSIISHLLSAWFAFLLPAYGTWKALSHRPLSEPDIERWGMYWTVLAAFVALEYVAEWLVSWFPFYWEVKTFILLFLALPQTQGSTWVYQTYVNPFLTRNEADIDAAIVQAQNNVLTFVQSRIGKLIDALLALVTGPRPQQPTPNESAASQQPATANPLGAAKSLWDTFGQGALNAWQSYSQSRSTQGATATSASPSPANAGSPSTSPAAPPFPEPDTHHSGGYM